MPDKESSEETSSMPDLGEGIDKDTFSQILEMDDDEVDRDFSKPLVMSFLEQAEETFNKMNEALTTRGLDELSSLGHFLKGSSATLGFSKIRDSCEKIQRYGMLENIDGTPEPDEEVCIQRIRETLGVVKTDFKDLKLAMHKFFGSKE